MRLIETCFILHLPHSSTEDYRRRREDEDEDEEGARRDKMAEEGGCREEVEERGTSNCVTSRSQFISRNPQLSHLCNAGDEVITGLVELTDITCQSSSGRCL